MGEHRRVARAETVGSLLRPAGLLEARRQLDEGQGSPATLARAEDEAVLGAIAMQEAAGLDVITDGEMRRASWAQFPEVLDCFERRPGGPGLVWHGATGEAVEASAVPYPTVVRPVGPTRRKDLVTEYRFLAEHARARTKYSLPAPSYHRRYWSPTYSTGAYDRCEAFLEDIRDVQRQIVDRLVGLGCDYIQLDAPNYGSLCDLETRQRMADQGRDLDAELAFDVALDNSLVAGLGTVTTALHICRGNGPGGIWHSSGGYANIAPAMFGHLLFSAVLLEYDTDRAGDFGPLAELPQGTVAVLGLLTTKQGALEDPGAVEARVREASSVKPLDELALSCQCGFASVASGNPLTEEEERAKLELVASLAHKIWSAPT